MKDWLLLLLVIVGAAIITRIIQSFCFAGMDVAVAKIKLKKLPKEEQDHYDDMRAYARGQRDASERKPPFEGSSSYLVGFLDYHKLHGRG